MTFYNMLSKHYSYIFPLSENHVTLFDSVINKESKNGLDIGCATGILTHALQKFVPTMSGIDLSETMIQEALVNQHNNLTFEVMDMTKISSEFKPSTFNLISCLGNTLVHVDHERVRKLLDDVYLCLKPNGQFMIQIVNYDLVLKEKKTSLPSIMNQKIEFHRHYIYPDDDSTIIFSAKLVDLDSHESFEDKTILYPFTHSQIIEWLKETGFKITHEFGAWNMSPYDEHSSPSLIVVAKKK
jgi:glycine/sarcosine N-methyltransferase